MPAGPDPLRRRFSDSWERATRVEHAEAQPEQDLLPEP